MTDALSPLVPPATLAQVGVALATHGKIPWRLAMVLDAWCALGVPVVVAAPQPVLDQLGDRDGLIPLAADTRPEALGDAMQAAIDAVPRPWALLGADDILPVPHTWRDRPLTLEPGTIQAVELRSELNQRWGDWATYDGTHIMNQPIGGYRPGTFIAGGAQLISPEARRAVSYRGRRYHDGDDIRYCWDAVMAGIRLRPADAGGPLLLHLDRFPPHPSDPERLGAPLAFGPAAPDVARFGELVFRIRPNTWDATILREVILADTYDLNLWRPDRDDATLVDIGAHIGGASAWLGAAHPGARVFAFEAAPENAALARLNTIAMPNVTLAASAVSDRDGCVRLHRMTGPNTGGHVVSAPVPPESDLAGSNVVACVGIETVFADLPPGDVDLLKLDCEGAEWPILETLAASGTIARVRHLVMELHLDPPAGRTWPTMATLLTRAFGRVRLYETDDPQLLRVMASA
jgi:FkbM family methyltransferase